MATTSSSSSSNNNNIEGNLRLHGEDRRDAGGEAAQGRASTAPAPRRSSRLGARIARGHPSSGGGRRRLSPSATASSAPKRSRGPTARAVTRSAPAAPPASASALPPPPPTTEPAAALAAVDNPAAAVAAATSSVAASGGHVTDANRASGASAGTPAPQASVRGHAVFSRATLGRKTRVALAHLAAVRGLAVVESDRRSDLAARIWEWQRAALRAELGASSASEEEPEQEPVLLDGSDVDLSSAPSGSDDEVSVVPAAVERPRPARRVRHADAVELAREIARELGLGMNTPSGPPSAGDTPRVRPTPTAASPRDAAPTSGQARLAAPPALSTLAVTTPTLASLDGFHRRADVLSVDETLGVFDWARDADASDLVYELPERLRLRLAAAANPSHRRGWSRPIADVLKLMDGSIPAALEQPAALEEAFAPGTAPSAQARAYDKHLVALSRRQIELVRALHGQVLFALSHLQRVQQQQDDDERLVDAAADSVLEHLAAFNAALAIWEDTQFTRVEGAWHGTPLQGRESDLLHARAGLLPIDNLERAGRVAAAFPLVGGLLGNARNRFRSSGSRRRFGFAGSNNGANGGAARQSGGFGSGAYRGGSRFGSGGPRRGGGSFRNGRGGSARPGAAASTSL